jgi:hypothetical protein
LDSAVLRLQTVGHLFVAVPGGAIVAGDSEEHQALALLQKEMLAFILEGVTERIERGEVPVLADAVVAAIARQVEAAIDSGFRRFDPPAATRIAQEVARIIHAEAETTAPPPAGFACDARSPREDPEVRGAEEGQPTQSPGWRRPATVWPAASLLLLFGLAGWFAWQKSSALQDESAARMRIAVERDLLSGEICKSAKAQQEQLAVLRNTAIYKANCSPRAAGPPDFCQAIDALGKASGPGADCSRQ